MSSHRKLTGSETACGKIKGRSGRGVKYGSVIITVGTTLTSTSIMEGTQPHVARNQFAIRATVRLKSFPTHGRLIQKSLVPVYRTDYPEILSLGVLRLVN
jgi:hypothetical protein